MHSSCLLLTMSCYQAVELLAARDGRDDLRVVRYQCGSLPEYHVIFEAT
jgi:hypothetical protein